MINLYVSEFYYRIPIANIFVAGCLKFLKFGIKSQVSKSNKYTTYMHMINIILIKKMRD